MRAGRLSNKRSDTRYVVDEVQWDSKKEWEVYNVLSQSRANVRRAVKGSGDTFDYVRPIRSARCVECGSKRVVQLCTYTPDIYVEVGRSAYWIEAKGFFQQSKRAAFRDFRKAHPGVDLRIVAFNNHKVGKGRLMDYLAKYTPDVPVILWNSKAPEFPKEWLR
jgi:hypothetical protein